MKTLLALAMIALANVKATEAEAIAAVAIGEAGGESKKCMEAICETIYWRARIAKRERLEVILQPGQFNCIGRLGKDGLQKLIFLAREHPRWEMALEIAGRRPTNHTGGATYFSEATHWFSFAPRHCKTVTINSMRFYVLPFPVQAKAERAASKRSR